MTINRQGNSRNDLGKETKMKPMNNVNKPFLYMFSQSSSLWNLFTDFLRDNEDSGAVSILKMKIDKWVEKMKISLDK